MASNIPEVPEGKTFVLFKKPRARSFSAAIRLSDGHKEVLDTTAHAPRLALAQTNQRLRRLYAERKLQSPYAIKHKGGPSAYMIKKRRDLGLPITATMKETKAATLAAKFAGEPAESTNGVPKRKGRPPNALKLAMPKLLDGRRKNVAIDDEKWGEFVRLTENSSTAAMNQITQLLLLGLPPEEFQQTCRAIVVRRLKL